MAYSITQVNYHKAFIFRANLLIEDLFASIINSSNWQAELETKLDQGSMLVGGAAAALGVAAVTAPVTGGLSLVATGAVLGIAEVGIVIARLASGGYKVVTKSSDFAGEDVVESSLEDNKLFFKLILQEVGDTLTIQYKHFIDEIIEEDCIATFAYFGAEYVVKKLRKELLRQLKEHSKSANAAQPIEFSLNPNQFVSNLMSSTHVPVLSGTEKIRIKDRYAPSKFMASNVVPVKWAYSRSRIALCRNILDNIVVEPFASKSENTHFSNTKTLAHYGYAAVSDSQVVRDKKLVTQGLAAAAISDLSNKLMIYYPVTPELVTSYLQEVRGTSGSRLSLNEYLSLVIGMNAIAACHDDRLKDLDLSGGNFSGVNFRGVVLAGNLTNTVWGYARLSMAKFDGVILSSSTNFSFASLEKSEWRNLELHGSFCKAKMNGAQIRNCLLADLNDIGCDWDLVYFDSDTRFSIDNEEWRKQTEQRLSSELLERVASSNLKLQEFIAWQQDQEAKWNSQDRVNEVYFRRIDSIDHWIDTVQKQPVIDILNHIQRNAQKSLETTISQPYIDLNVLPAGVGDKTAPLFEKLMHFQEDPLELFFLLHGVIGSGKSMSVIRFAQELLLNCRTQNDYYPILIKLKHVQANSSTNFLEECLLTQFDHAQIEVLKRNFTCIVILDGLDDCGIDFNQRYIFEECLEFFAGCANGSWKVLLTSSTQLLLEANDYRESLRWSQHVSFPYESEYSLLPLTRQQIDTYINAYYSGVVSFSEVGMQDLYKLAQTPIMLRIICEVLSENKLRGTSLNSKTEFYEAFLEDWSEHVLQKAGAQRLQHRSILVYLQDCAYQMFTEDRQHIERPIIAERDALEIERDSELSVDRNDFNYLFDNPLWKRAGMLAPLKVRRDEARQVMIYQIRAPFRMYALAGKLVSLLGRPTFAEVLTSWNYAFLAEPATFSVFESLVKIINSKKNKQYYLNVLCRIVDASCRANGELYAKAASNAITLLNALDFDFSVNLEKHRWRGAHINKANLRYGKFSGFDFSYSNLEETKWHQAELIGVLMIGANVNRIQLFEGKSVIFTGKDPETFAVYPSDEPVIAYSALQNIGSEEREITIVGSGGEKYQKISGIQNIITSMAWGVSNTEQPVAYLATATASGTIHIWRINKDNVVEIDRFRTNPGAQINTIKWYKDGELIAAGGDDNYVRIWSMRNRKCIFAYDLKAPATTVVFGRDEKLMLSVDRSGTLNIWSLTELKSRASLEQPPTASINAYPNAIPNPALSVALAVPERFAAVGYANGDIVVFSVDVQRFEDAPTDINLTASQVLTSHASPVNSIVWNAHCLVSGSSDGLIVVWDVHAGVSVTVYQGDGVPVHQVAWLMGGRQIVTSQDRKLSIYDPDYHVGRTKHVDKLNAVITQVAPQDTYIAMGDVLGKIWLCDVADIANKSTQNIYSHGSQIISLEWSNDNCFLASLSTDDVIKIYDLYAESNNVFTFTEYMGVRAINWIIDATDKTMKFVIYCANGELVFFVNNPATDPSWQLCNTVNIAKSPETYTTIAFAKDSAKGITRYFCVYANFSIRLYNMDDLTSYTDILGVDYVLPNVVELQFSKDGRYLLAKSIDQTLSMWETNMWHVVWEDSVLSYDKKVLLVTSEDQKNWLLVGTKDGLEFYSLSSGVHLVNRTQKPVDSLAYNAGCLFVAEKKSVDLFDFVELSKGANLTSSFRTRLGYGTAVMGLDLHGARNLDTSTKAFADCHGALLSRASPRSDFASTVLHAIGFYHRRDYSELPPPIRQTSTSHRVTHLFYRAKSNFSGSELEKLSSGEGSPDRLLREHSLLVLTRHASPSGDLAASDGQASPDTTGNL